MKHFLLFLCLLPNLLLALNEKECNAYFKTAIEEMTEAVKQAKQVKNQPIEIKINLVNAALQGFHRAVLNFDIIIHDIHEKKAHKIRPWQKEIKQACQNQKDICLHSFSSLQKNLVVLKAIAFSEQKLKEEKNWIDIVNNKFVEIQSFSAEQKLDPWYHITLALKQAIISLQHILWEISLIADPEIRTHLMEWQLHAENRIKDHEQSIQEIERNIGVSKFYAAANVKFEEANALAKDSYPSALKEIPNALKALDSATLNYEEALLGYQQALLLSSQTDQAFLKNRIIHLEELIESCKKRTSELLVDKQTTELIDQLAILEKREDSLIIKRAIASILEELEKPLDLVESQIADLEITCEKSKIPHLTDEEFCKIQENLRTEFFKNNTIIPQDISVQKENNYILYLKQFYQFFVKNSSSFLHVDVYQDFEVIHTEQIPLPDTSLLEWNNFVTAEGLVCIPNTTLTTEFGLQLRIIAASEMGGFIIKLKAENPNYQFSFSCENTFACSFIASPPWQLEMLRKEKIAINKPREKLPPNVSFIPNSLATASIELAPHAILDKFVEEMKNDPLALAQYVQNEIELVDPWLLKENSALIPPYIQRGALGVFLEKQGSPWEQCALLVYLLRKAGFEAVYAHGVSFSLPTDYVEKLLFTQLPDKETSLKYPWVLFFDGNQWISLFPWMKDIYREEGHDLYNFLPEDYATAERWIQHYLTNDPNILKHIGPDKEDTTAILLVRFLEEHLKKQGLSLQDIGIHQSINKKQFANWLDFPRIAIKDDFQTVSGLNEIPNLFTQVMVEIENSDKKILSPWAFLTQVTQSPYTIHCEADLLHFHDGVNHRLLKLDPYDPNIKIKIHYNYGNLSQTFTILKGTTAAICFNVGGSNAKIPSFFGDKFANTKEDIPKLHALLSFVGAVFFDKCCRAESALSKLHKLSPSTLLNFGLVKLSSKEDLIFPQVDMFKFARQRESFGNEKDLASRQLAALMCLDTSSNEHQVLREIFHDPYAISTVKLLQIAHESHQSKGLPGLGFLNFTEKSFKEAEHRPILAQCLYFNQLKGLNLTKIKSQAADQWQTASSCLNSTFSYAYMTPGPIESQDDPPSYTGIGTIIVHKIGSFSLIGNGLSILNGGYGSRLPSTALNSLNNWQVVQNNTHFSFLQPGRTPISESIEAVKLKSDVRPDSKSGYDTVADPVDIVSGAFYIDEVDLTLPGSFPLELRRNYNSQNPIAGLLGKGWKISLNPYLVEEGDHLFAAEEDGTVINYRLNPKNSRWEVFPEDNLELRNNSKKGIGGTANPYHAYIENHQGFILHGGDGSIRKFENKCLKEWIDHAGNSLIFTYHQDQLVKIENSQNGFLGFYYNHEGKISEAYTKDGRRVYYTYDCQGNLVQVELPNGALITYDYDAFHQIIKESKPQGRLLENTYDALGRVIEQYSPNGVQQQMVLTAKFTYKENVHIATDAAGAQTEYKIFQNQIYKITDPEGNQIFQSSFLDANTWFDAETEQVLPWEGKGSYPRSLKSLKDKRGLVTQYLYDERGNPIEITLKGNDLGNGEQQMTKYRTYNEHNLCILEEALSNKAQTIYEGYLPKRIEKYAEDKLIGYTEFHYQNGQIVVEDNCGAITRWEYDSRGFPTKKTQETGTEDPDVVTTFHYNNQGQCIEQISPDAIFKNDYDIMGNPYKSSIYALSGEPISIKYAGYDLNNLLIWQMGADPKDILYIDYNLAGLPKATRQLLSKVNRNLQIEEAGVAYTLFDYDSRGHLIQEVDAQGECTCREYDLLGRVSTISKMNESTHFSYEAGGLLAQTLVHDLKITKEYSTNGLLIKESYPEEEVLFKYDLFGRPTSKTMNGQSLTIEYDDVAQKVIHKNQGAIVKIEEFDSQGHLISLTDALGNVWRKQYDHLGRLKIECDPQGEQTTWQYEGDHITCILPSQEKNIQRYQAGKVVESQTFDSKGTLLTYIRSEYCPFTNSHKETTGDLITTTWMNTQGKPLAIQQGELVTLNHYDPCGYCIATTDGEGNTTQKQFDALGRLIKKILPSGSVVTYEYDSYSNLTTCHLPGEVSWKASYDLMGRKTHEELQANESTSQQWKYTYDQGKLKEATDPNNFIHSYSYDTFGRIVEEQVDNYKKLYTYDRRGLLTSAEQIGHDHTKLERSYDCKGRLTLETISLNSQLIQKTHQTWETAKRTLQIEEHQRQFHYAGGHLVQISTPEITLDYHYNTSGSLIHRSNNYLTTHYAYNSSGLPTSLSSQMTDNVYEEILQWNKSGKIKSYQFHGRESQEEKAFCYNSQGQLNSINEETYAFDFDKPGSGIRTKAPHWTVPSHGLDPFGKIIAEICDGKEISTRYNHAGQVISRAAESFKWDPFGNLIEISCDAYTWAASYDALGRRLQTINLSPDEQPLILTSLYDPEKEFEEIGLKYKGKTFWKLGHHSCEVMIDEKGNTISLIYDALGSLLGIIDSEKVHWSTGLASPYGPRGPPPSLEPNLHSIACAHSWQSRRMDSTGYIWMGARYYDPTGGKFLSRDPVGIPLSLDLYSYANGDPVNFNDPDGRFASPIYKPQHANTFNLSQTHRKPAPKVSLEPPSSHTVGIYSYFDKRIFYSNGMNTPLKSALKASIYLSALGDNHQVHLIYNPTHGIMKDCERWYDSCKNGVLSPVVAETHKEWNEAFASLPENAHILHICFSEGVTNARNALMSYDKDLRQRIEVIAYCPSAYIDRSLCASVVHYCSSNDYVHRIVCEGLEKDRPNVVILERHPKASKWFDHSATSPTFTKALQQEIDEYLKR